MNTIKQTNCIQWSKQTLHNKANKLFTMEQTNFTMEQTNLIQYSKQNLIIGANKLYTMEQTNLIQ